METVDLKRRATPRQRRSQERIRVIIAAAKGLLVKQGAEAITTSAVAEEAQVPVSSVYRYFPNIYSVHAAILEEFLGETDRIVDDVLNDPAIQDWRDSLGLMTGALRDIVRRDPSYGAAFRLTMTTHELRSLREDWSRRLAGRLAERWEDGRDGFVGDDPRLVARMTVELYSAAEMLAFERRDDDALADACFNEGLVALERYLAPYFD